MIRAWSRRNIRPRVATWSLRDRPARSLPPSCTPAPLNKAALQRPVDVLIGLRRQVGARGNVLVQLCQGREHSLKFAVVQQPGLMQHTGVGLGAGDIVAGQAPVKMRGLAQRREGIGGAAGEPAAPTSRSLSRNGLSCYPFRDANRS